MMHPYAEENDRLLAKIADIKAQIEHAKGEAAASGIYRDPNWFARVNQALRHAQREHQALQRTIGEWNAKNKRERAGRFEQCFIEASKRTLHPETFQAIWDEAHQEFQGDNR